MNAQKLFSVFALFAFVIISLASTTALSFGSQDSNHPLESLTPNSNVTIVLTNNDGVDQDITLTFENSGFSNIADLTATPSSFSLPAGDSQSIVVSVASLNDGLAFGGTTSATLNASSTQGFTTTTSIDHFESFCRSGPSRQNILEISKVDISNEGTSDGDDDEWFVFDDIEVQVEVENNGNDERPEDDLQDLIIEIGLIDSNGLRNVIGDFEFFSGSDEEEEGVGDMDPDEEEEHTFEFRLEDSDEDLDGAFDLVVKVYEEGNEDGVCVDFSDDLESMGGFSESIDLERENDEEKFVRFTEISVSPLQATCGEPVTVTADVINVGDEDVEQLQPRLFNTVMGIDIEQTIREDLDAGDREDLSFNFVVPNNIQDGKYDFILDAIYEVDDDDVSADEPEIVSVNVIGCEVGSGSGNNGNGGDSGSSGDNVAISASLASDARAGEELVVSSTITNTGSDLMVVAIDARAFQSWGELQSISQRTLTLNPGDSRSVTLTFDVNEDAQGPQSFIIETNAAGRIGVQEVEVNIAGDDSGSGAGFEFGDTNLIWVIVIVNIILIILIILVAVRLSRR